MLSIGIDVSKGKSTVCGMKPGGEIVYTPSCCVGVGAEGEARVVVPEHTADDILKQIRN